MESKVVRIGNSGGVIIPSFILHELGLNVGSILNITVSKLKGELVIKRQSVRRGWSEAFKEYAKDPDDLIFADFIEDEIVE